MNELIADKIESETRAKTTWHLIIGGASLGKTTTVNMLKEKGCKTTIEHAHHYIDTQRQNGRTVEDIRNHQVEFQKGVLDMQIEQEGKLSPDEIVFLDRAIPDALAYYRFLNLEPDKMLPDAIKKASYRKVFILDYLPLVMDYVRTEDVAAQRKIHELLCEVYKSLPFPVIHVPVLSPEKRMEPILENLWR